MPATRLSVYCSRSQVRGTALGRVVLLSVFLPRYKYSILYRTQYINEQKQQILYPIYVNDLYCTQ